MFYKLYNPIPQKFKIIYPTKLVITILDYRLKVNKNETQTIIVACIEVFYLKHLELENIF